MTDLRRVIQTRAAARGNTTTIKGTDPPKSIASMAFGPKGNATHEEVDDVEGLAFGCTIQFDVGPIVPGPGELVGVQWVVTWGYGGVSRTRTMFAQEGRLNVVADWVRVSAQLLSLSSTAVTSASTAQVSCAVVPAVDGQTRWATKFNGENQFFESFVGADRYLLSSGPCTLWAVSGYRYDAGVQPTYLMLFDANGVAIGPPGIPNGLGGQVASNANFSLGLLLSGRDFFQGLVLAASSTGGVYTQDATIRIACDVELLNN